MTQPAKEPAPGTEAGGRGVRVESGPVRIGDDWAGVFIRGDQAMCFALAVDGVVNDWLPDAERPAIEDIIRRNVMIGLADTLRSCHEPCEAVALRRALATPTHSPPRTEPNP